jgi:hypothetical protein
MQGIVFYYSSLADPAASCGECGRCAFSVNTRIKNRQNLFEHTLGSPSDQFSLPCSKIERLDLFHHNEPGNAWVVHNGHMKGEMPIGAGYGANYSQAGVSVERSVAYDKGRPATSLLMA